MVQLIEDRIRLEEPDQLDKLSENLKKKFRDAELNSGLAFIIPMEIKHNKDKHVYKIGFLSEFLKRLYPEKSFTEICKVMSARYDIFISRRQIDRTRKKFLEDSN